MPRRRPRRPQRNRRLIAPWTVRPRKGLRRNRRQRMRRRLLRGGPRAQQRREEALADVEEDTLWPGPFMVHPDDYSDDEQPPAEG